MNNTPRFFFLAALFFLTGTALASEFRLDDGTILRGAVVSRTDSTLVLLNPTLGEVTLSRAHILSGDAVAPRQDSTAVSPAKEASLPKARDLDPAGYALFFMPTAFTPPANAFTFRDFELFFLNFGYSPTSTTSLSTGFVFPVTGSFQILSLGVKQQILNSSGTAVAITGSLTIPLEDGGDPLVNTNLVVSHRFALNGYSDALGLHAAVGYVSADGEGATGFALGAEARMGDHAKFIAEYVAAQETSQNGLFTFGIRLHGERLSADIAAMRPVGIGSEIQFLPLVVVNYRF